ARSVRRRRRGGEAAARRAPGRRSETGGAAAATHSATGPTTRPTTRHPAAAAAEGRDRASADARTRARTRTRDRAGQTKTSRERAPTARGRISRFRDRGSRRIVTDADADARDTTERLGLSAARLRALHPGDALAEGGARRRHGRLPHGAETDRKSVV